MSGKIWRATAITLIICIVGCSRLQSDLVKVGDDAISVAEFKRELLRLHVKDRKAARIILDNQIRDHLLFQAATKTQIRVSEEEVEHALRSTVRGFSQSNLRKQLHSSGFSPNQFRAQVTRRLVIEKYLSDVLKITQAIKDEDIAREWEKSDHRWTPRSVHVRHILFLSSEEATVVREQIQRGEITFEGAARKYGNSPERDVGGDLGWISPGRWLKVFDVCFELAKNELSAVIASEYGFHLFLVIDERPAHTQGVAEAKNRIRMQLEDQQKNIKLDQLIKRLSKQQGVRVNETQLKNLVESL